MTHSGWFIGSFQELFSQQPFAELRRNTIACGSRHGSQIGTNRRFEQTAKKRSADTQYSCASQLVVRQIVAFNMENLFHT